MTATVMPETIEAGQGLTRLGPAWHRRVRDLHVLKVKGSFLEMGRQHGALLGDAIREGPVPYYRSFIERMAGPVAGPLVVAMCKRVLGWRLVRRMPDFARETIRGLAQGSGIPEAELREGCTMPDALLWLVARMIQAERAGLAVDYRALAGLGCTSAIAWGDATTDGRLLHARNFDYHGVSCWPRAAAVIFHEPAEGQRYVSISSAGVPLGGVTAMNAAGLTLTVHQHMFTDGTRLGGTPIGVIGDVIMRDAQDLDDAERILASHRPVGCWTYLVTDGNRREVLCWEENPRRGVARRVGEPEGTFGTRTSISTPSSARRSATSMAPTGGTTPAAIAACALLDQRRGSIRRRWPGSWPTGATGAAACATPSRWC
ncbi:MAG: C45 family peptidase [Acidobacteriota bacterium]